MIGRTIAELRAGDTDKVAKTVSESDIYLYAMMIGLCGHACADIRGTQLEV